MRPILTIPDEHRELFAEARTQFQDSKFDLYYALAELQKNLCALVNELSLMILFATHGGVSAVQKRYQTQHDIAKLLAELAQPFFVTRIAIAKDMGERLQNGLEGLTNEEEWIADLVRDLSRLGETSRFAYATDDLNVVRRISLQIRVHWEEEDREFEEFLDFVLATARQHTMNGMGVSHFACAIADHALNVSPLGKSLFEPLRIFSKTPELLSHLLLASLWHWLLLSELSDGQIEMGALDDESLADAIASELTVESLEVQKRAAENLEQVVMASIYNIFRLHVFAYQLGHPDAPSAADAFRRVITGDDPLTRKRLAGTAEQYESVQMFVDLMSQLANAAQ